MNLRSVKVRPASAVEGQDDSSSEPFFKRILNYLTKVWYHSQIGHRSEYSVERLLAFRDYYDRTSIAHAVAVCIITPIPALLVTLLIDCIPLRPPGDGWIANYTLWIRLGFDALVVAFGHASRVGEMVVAGTVSTVRAIWIAIGTSVCCVALSIGVAATWKFPIPFGYVLLHGPYLLIFCVVTILAIGPRLLIKAPLLRGQLKSHLLIVFAEGLMATVYPIFIGIFYRLTETQQIVAVFVLPVIKVTTKQLIAYSAAELQECLGLVVVFSVDVFNVFFTAMCMQVSKSTVSTLLMIASDCFHMIVALRTIFIKVNIVKKQRNYEDTETQQSLDYFRDLPGMIREVFGDSEISKARSCRIRVFAPFPLSLSDESIAFMNDVARTRRYVHIYSSSVIQLSDQTRRESISRGRATGRLSEIGGVGALTMFTESKVLVPLNQRQERPMRKQSLHLLLKARFASRKGSAPRRLLTLMHSDTKIASHTLRAVLSHNTSEEAVWDALQVHFHSEYLLMTEYIECTLPILYVVYLLVLSQLPVAPYYPNIASLTSEQLTKTILSLTIFSLVELAGFLGLLVLLRERFGFLPLYQLAFVLETQVHTLQGHLFVWTVFILHLPLVHYGVNFDA